MGYTTHFSGEVSVSPALNEAEQTYLRKFAQTRRVDRERGPYFVDGAGFMGQGPDTDIKQNNEPPPGQPGLWCQWVPSEGGGAIEWDEGEKFYEAAEWMVYLIDTFLKPGCTVEKEMEDGRLPDEIAAQFADFTFDHVCKGEIEADGEEPDDFWRLVVTDNIVEQIDGRVAYADETEPPVSALAEIAAMLPTEDEWRNAADFMEAVAGVLDRHNVERPEHYPED